LMIAAPSDEAECRRLLSTAYRHDGPSAVRYPRGSGPGAEIEPGLEPLPIGKGLLRRQGARVAILAFGAPLQAALAAADKLDATVADMRFIKPLDRALIEDLARRHDYLVTVEENAVAGGAGEAVAELLAELGLNNRVLHLGLPDRFVEQGDPAVLLARLGLDAAGIEARIRELLAE
ncbi:MAG: transketolase C-terminal domain-containing protein, partial [Pseudomonadota bacterium]